MALSVAVLDGDRQQVFDLIFADANVNEPNDVGNTPLHAAAFVGNVEFARILVRAGARVNSRGNHGRTPLHIASGNDRGDEVVRFLLDECRADARIEDDYGKTPRDYASPKCAILLDAFLFSQCAPIIGSDNDLPVLQGAIFGTNSNLTSPRRPDPSAKEAQSLLAALSQKLLNEHESVSSQASPPKAGLNIMQHQPSTPKPSVQIQGAVSVARDRLNSLSFSAVKNHEQPTVTSITLSEPFDHNELNKEVADAPRSPRGGFYIEVDGAEVFVPFNSSNPIIKSQSETGFRDDEDGPKTMPPVQREDDGQNDDQDEDVIEENIWAKMTVGPGASLGMLLEEIEDDSTICVTKLRRSSLAYRAGIRVGDRIVMINGKDMSGYPLEEVIGHLDASELDICFYRKKPRIVVEMDSLDWTNTRQAYRIKQVIRILQSPPSSLSPDEVMQLIQSFQAAVSLARRNEAPEDLVRFMSEALAGESSSNIDLAESAATVVHRAARRLEELEDATVNGDPSLFSTVIGTIQL